MLQIHISYSCRLLLLILVVCFTASEGACQEESTQRVFLDRTSTAEFQLRVMCWNVKVSSIFPPAGKRQESFGRIVRAVKPDVICLQEILRRGQDDLVQLMQQVLPLGQDQAWHVHVASDNAVVSRFPLLQRQQELPVPFPLLRAGLPDFHYGHAMCLVDIPSELSNTDFYVIAMHNKSRSGAASIRMRQRQSDAIVRWIRDAKRPGDAPTIADKTPILIIGDMNVLTAEPADAAHHLTTLLTGNIVDETAFGPDCPMDWDGTTLVEVKPRHNSRDKDFYTWRIDHEPFPPGALDRMIYTDSVVSVSHSFVLNTTTMTKKELEDNGLLSTDVLWEGEPGNFDHLPLVADFLIRRTAGN